MSPKAFYSDTKAALELLERHAALEPGLSNSEIRHVEEVFAFTFPPDLRALLQTAMPIGVDSNRQSNAFPNWRSGDRSELQGRLNWPFEGIAFDIEHNGFWLEKWGARPTNLADAIRVAKGHVDVAPKLIPLFFHRYLPASPLLAGNPVFSVYQTDIIVYGRNLWDYLLHEFDQRKWRSTTAEDAPAEDLLRASNRIIPFWSELAD